MIEISKNVLILGVAIWLLICSLRGYYAGLLRELYDVAQLLLALLALWFVIGHLFSLDGGIPTFSGFLVSFFIVRWIGKLLGIVNHIPILGGFNRTLGVLLGFFKGVAMLALVYNWLGDYIRI